MNKILKLTINKILDAVHKILLWCYNWLFFIFYRKIYVPFKVEKVRKKEKIKVVFVLDELASWKTEDLYLKMLEHPRFTPSLLLLPEKHSQNAFDIFKDYLEKNHYNYTTMNPGETIKRKYKPDIIFYQKPYGDIIDNKYFYLHNLSSLFCYVAYCFRNRCHPGANRIHFVKAVWQLYAENDRIVEELKPIMFDKASNMVVTGLPIMDELLKAKSFYEDPWKKCSNLKRIIYAPHHTICTENVRSNAPYDYSTFLEYADFMLELAEKYKKSVQWSFKPHPFLKMKLYKIWGKERTEAYYEKWQIMENCQLSEGEYKGLFKHSDAMIHDCGSFKLEYLYTGNPVMYLIKEDQEYDYPNWQTREALKLHYHAYSSEDIEKFIKDVIGNNDPLKEERDVFVSKYLTPPNNKTACENIINAILGEKEYS